MFRLILNIIYVCVVLTCNVVIYVYLKMFGDIYISNRFWEIISLIIEPSSSLPFLGGCETCDIYLIFKHHVSYIYKDTEEIWEFNWRGLYTINLPPPVTSWSHGVQNLYLRFLKVLMGIFTVKSMYYQFQI